MRALCTVLMALAALSRAAGAQPQSDGAVAVLYDPVVGSQQDSLSLYFMAGPNTHLTPEAIESTTGIPHLRGLIGPFTVLSVPVPARDADDLTISALPGDVRLRLAIRFVPEYHGNGPLSAVVVGTANVSFASPINMDPFDLNMDARVDSLDIQAALGCRRCVWDMTGDGRVDSLDTEALQSAVSRREER